MATQYDFALTDHPFGAIVEPLTDAARDWCADNFLDPEDAETPAAELYRWQADYHADQDVYFIDQRDAVDIAEAIHNADLTAPGLATVFGA